MSEISSDRIEKRILLRAPRPRVWRALSDSGEFGAWFGVKLEGNFAVGKRVNGRITSAGYDHLTMELTIVQMDAEHFFSFRWHPYAIDPRIDYSTEPATLVEFRLDEVPDGTMLTLVESGFDRIPIARRNEAFRMNSQGWAAQVESIQRHVGG